MARTGTIMDVEHIVILMQENRSFDHYFGTLKGVRGFGDRFPIPVAGGRQVWTQRNDNPGASPALLMPFHLNTRQSFDTMRAAGGPHTWPDAQRAWNNGILDAWPTHKENHAMGHYRQADIPFQFALANLFTVCDAYHCALHAGTNPNRVFGWTGSIDPLQQANGPVIGNLYDNMDYDHAGGYGWTTYPERLQAAGISWQVYQDMDDNYTNNPLAGFKTFRAAFARQPGADPQLRERALVTRTIGQMEEDAIAGTLPQVSYIIATAAGSEHPLPSSPAQGAEFTARVIKALTANPDVWRKTVLFLMYDENDGYFDHVPPPAVPSYSDDGQLAGASTVDTTGEYHRFPSTEDSELPELMDRPYGLGPRVPMIVISPWSRGGWVNSQVFDHTSVIRFMERRFGVIEPGITPWRRAVCGDMCSAFDFTRPDERPFMHLLPSPAADAERARMLGETCLPPLPPSQSLPRQEPGVRPSRALPYELHVHEQHTDPIALRFSNAGKAAAVFHVYDRLRLHHVPRRYTVEPGRELADSWPAGDYDLWVLGPNGFHRHFVGRAGGKAPHLNVSYDGRIVVSLHNRSASPVTFEVVANAYLNGQAWRGVLAPDEQASHGWPLAESGNWYDFSLRLPHDPTFARRFAGRLETGSDSISDPA